MIAPLIFNLVIIAVFASFYWKDNKKAVKAFNLALKSLLKIAPLIIIIIILLVFIQEILSAERLISYISGSSGPLGYVIAAFAGAFFHIPLFIAFPIGGQLLENSVNPGFIAVLITSLVMVHSFSIPIEVKELGLRFAVLRNSLSIIAAILIGAIIGVLY